MTKHTPAPWDMVLDGTVIKKRIHYPLDVDETVDDDESWLSMRRRTDHLREENERIRECNRRLGNAAPELLEALERAVSMAKECVDTAVNHQDTGCCEQLLNEMIGDFEKAIKKAHND